MADSVFLNRRLVFHNDLARIVTTTTNSLDFILKSTFFSTFIFKFQTNIYSRHQAR